MRLLPVAAAAAIAAALPGGVARAQADWPEFYVPPPPPPDWSVTAHFLLGGGYDASIQGADTGAVAGSLELLVRCRAVLVGVFLDAAGAGDSEPMSTEAYPQNPARKAHESVWWGAAAGVAWEPVRWARLHLLAQGGLHQVVLDSLYVEPSGTTDLPFLGVKAGAGAFMDLTPPALGMRRLGAVLQLDLRTDLGTGSVQPGTPAGVPPVSEVGVGGASAIVTFGLAIEW